LQFDNLIGVVQRLLQNPYRCKKAWRSHFTGKVVKQHIKRCLLMLVLAILLSSVLILLFSRTSEAAYADTSHFVRIQAHRGYSGHYPENTLLAFSKAIEAGADQMELDVHISADNEVFVMHDDTVDRTTNGTGRIHELTAAQIKQLDAGSWRGPEFVGVQVPTLAEVLALCKSKVKVNIELKARKVPEALWKRTVDYTVGFIDTCEMWDDVLFSSFSLPAIAYVKQIRPQATVGLLDWDLESTVDRQPQVIDIGGTGWFAHPQLATPERVAQAHERGLFVISAAGNEAATREATVQAHINAGVDFISSNYTREVIDLLESWGFSKVAG